LIPPWGTPPRILSVRRSVDRLAGGESFGACGSWLCCPRVGGLGRDSIGRCVFFFLGPVGVSMRWLPLLSLIPR